MNYSLTNVTQKHKFGATVILRIIKVKGIVGMMYEGNFGYPKCVKCVLLFCPTTFLLGLYGKFDLDFMALI